MTGVFLLTPALAFSAPSLAARLKGRILLAVEDMGKTYYVAPDGYRYLITRATAQKIFEKLALGITNKNLEQIPIKEIAVEPEPQVAGDSVQVIEKVVEKIVYVDKPVQCQYDSTFYINQIESYKNEISDLNKQISLLKEQNASGQPNPITESKNALKNSLNKEYSLKINNYQKQLLDTKFQYDNAEQIVKQENPGWNATIIARILSDYKRDKQARITDLSRTISVLQNELERKLLELE